MSFEYEGDAVKFDVKKEWQKVKNSGELKACGLLEDFDMEKIEALPRMIKDAKIRCAELAGVKLSKEPELVIKLDALCKLKCKIDNLFDECNNLGNKVKDICCEFNMLLNA